MADRYRQIFLSFSDAVFIEDASGVILDANTAAAWLLGYPRPDLIGRKTAEFFAPGSRERLAEQLNVLKSVERHQFDAQFVNASGALVNVIFDVSLLPESDDSEGAGDGQPVYLIVARQSSKRDELERELRLQRSSAAATNQQCKQASFFISLRNEISRYPPPAAGEAPGALDWFSTLLKGQHLKHALERAWAGEDALLPPAWYAPPAAGQNGGGSPMARSLWLRVSLHPIRVRGVQVTDVYVHVADETAERIRSEDQSWDCQRRFSTLAGNALFHDLNNYLGVILAQASALRLSVPQGEMAPAGVGAIVDAAQQAATLLRRSTDATDATSISRTEISLNDMLHDCAPLLAQGSVEVTLETADDLPLISGHLGLLKAMLLALGRCARTAMRGTGRMHMKSFRVGSSMPGLPPSVGVSISAETPSRASEGNIQELALVRAILRQSNGQLETVSSSAHGMLWEITLPVAQAGADALPSAPESNIAARAEASQSAPANGIEPLRPPGQPLGKILLADDEENFRLFTSWALQERGYEITLAKDGQEAFERFQDAPESFSLVILDAYMPRMGGLESYLRMQVLRPDLPVLFASGFARGPSVDALVSGCPGPAAVLLKPFSSEDLLVAVQKALTPQ